MDSKSSYFLYRNCNLNLRVTNAAKTNRFNSFYFCFIVYEDEEFDCYCVRDDPNFRPIIFLFI